MHFLLPPPESPDFPETAVKLHDLMVIQSIKLKNRAKAMEIAEKKLSAKYVLISRKMKELESRERLLEEREALLNASVGPY